MNKVFLKAHIEKDGERRYRFLASTSSIDRHGDSVDQSGWELRNFMRNPVILWAHRYDELPLGKVIEISVTESGLEADIVFADGDANPKAKQVQALVDEGILNAVSVGFIPKERSGNIITRAELLEISIVPVPANQDALALASVDYSLVAKDISDFLTKDADTIDEPEVVEPDDASITDETEVKEGRVISKTTRKALESTLASLQTAVSELEKLLIMSEVATTENEEEGAKNFVVISRSVVDDLKNALRSDVKGKEQILSSLKGL